MTELEFAKKISEIGGVAYLVGGAVRDKIRGVIAHDRDYCVAGVVESDFVKSFPDAAKFGKSFPVYSVEINGKKCEVAFARTEKKIGEGYRGFSVEFSPNVTIVQDLFRRDTTINAMAIEILGGELIDPFGGRADVVGKKIRAVSEHFVEDPVRALRAARQSAQFDFEITQETLEAMNFCADELKKEAGERIFAELKNALKTDKPSIFFRSLERAGILEVTFPEISQMRGKIHSVEHHPEGDAYEHTLKIVDDVAKINSKPRVCFAALAHDLGKGTTLPEKLPHHHGHDKRGLDVLNEMDRRIKLPGDWKKFAAFVISEHMRAPMLMTAGKIVTLLEKIHSSKISVADFNDVIRADHGGLPPHLEHAEFIIGELFKISGRSAPKNLVGAEIGDWLHAERIRRFVELRDKNFGGDELD